MNTCKLYCANVFGKKKLEKLNAQCLHGKEKTILAKIIFYKCIHIHILLVKKGKLFNKEYIYI